MLMLKAIANKILVPIIAVVVVAIAAVALLSSGGLNMTYNSQQPESQSGSQSETADQGSNQPPATDDTNDSPGGSVTPDVNEDVSTSVEHSVSFDASGYIPKDLTIKAGDKVTWTNNHPSAQTWPASAVHPTHSVYPEGGGCLGSKFDACKGLVNGESFSFVFNQKGKWNYHDHLNPSQFGTITVE